ncbi:L-lysine 6-transaminase [Epilithonimonas ginsengisoli]|uniref:L-lysine-epsilon aminotransferase n=1 Tax=Epilithonimonas ginsengisoli TaxID=1245592 RepID=A0ABU4JG37_9FLAO|nr:MULTISPECIES: L-lysine 6-transaminase [Chryseobacterium group]MBV6879997.1 L-lysine 6-transaminase [Epilithonimonas sp. FP105]MDW8548647.1 L-lysine 6-transaminase [Epilithonimonas ginsengisoli]OAH75093.1 L-lysine 6-transaminase [Chryseobacterium sp. FP211-J200]
MITTTENKVKETLGKHILADGFDFVMDFEKSHGSYIVDRLTGKEYLDMFSMFASASVGYNHPYILEKANWLGKMAIYKPTLSDVYLQEYADFMDVFSRVAIPKELPYCFFVEGGALAVENALKTAFDWKTRKNWQKDIDKEASLVIHFKQSFHGRSGYTLSLTNTSDPRKHQYFPKFEWPRITNPKLNFPITEENLKETIKHEQMALLNIQEAILANPDEVACIIIEPIQAEGGDNHFRNEFFVELRRICDENEILLILDEVQTGIGMTGKMWAYEDLGIIPDVISFGKKTQVCGILANKEKLDEVEHHVFVESSRINSTFGGNFIDMLRFQLVLEIIENENLVENSKVVGEFLLDGLLKLEQKFPEQIFASRGKGLMCAFDLKDHDTRNWMREKLYDEGIIVLTCGDQSIRFRPHLNVTKEEINIVLDKINSLFENLI